MDTHTQSLLCVFEYWHTHKVFPLWDLSRWNLPIPDCLLASLSKCPWDSSCTCASLSLSVFLSVVRKLQEFELPYVSITSLRSPEFHILLRKRYPPPVHIMIFELQHVLPSSALLHIHCNYSHDSVSRVCLCYLSDPAMTRVWDLCF